MLGGTAALVYQVLDPAEARGAEVARAARLSASATSAALRVLAEHGLAERGPGGWRRGPAALDDVAESTGAADLQREREARYKQDRESWRARLRQYQGARSAAVAPRDGWWAWTTRTSGLRCSAGGRCSAMTSCAGRPRPERGRALMRRPGLRGPAYRPHSGRARERPRVTALCARVGTARPLARADGFGGCRLRVFRPHSLNKTRERGRDHSGWVRSKAMGSGG